MSMTLVEIDGVLKQLRLGGMRATLETRLLESQASNLSVLETVCALLQDERKRFALAACFLGNGRGTM